MRGFARMFWVAALAVMILMAAAPVLAQDSPPGEPAPVITVEEAAQLLLNAIGGIVLGGFGTAPITLFLVSVIKRFIPAEYPASLIQWFIALGLTAVFWIVQSAGFETQFNSVTDFILLVGPALLTLITGLTVSSAMYQVAKAQHVPIFGYQRE